MVQQVTVADVLLQTLQTDAQTPIAIQLLTCAIHQTAIDKGWWTTPKTFGEQIALFHSELSEALEEFRNGHTPNEIYYGEDEKPEGVPIELADCIIRILDTCGFYNIDIWAAIMIKTQYNLGRSHRHGGKVL